MRLRYGLGLLLLILLLPAESHSHLQKFSNSELRVAGSQANWILYVHLTDFEQMFRGAGETEVQEFLPKRLQLKGEGQACNLQTAKLEKDLLREVVTIRLSYRCGKSGPVKVDYGLFFGDPNHRHLLKFNRGEGSQGFTFTPARTAAEFHQTSRGAEFSNFLLLGFEHILAGLDHILFVLSLVFGAKHLKKLLWLVTAFTVAHSLTLGLAAAGLFSLSPRLVEPAIAASIAFVAIRHAIARQDQDFKGDVFVAFFFGLIHGLGFSGALLEAGLSMGNLAWPLLSFNLGVELGQILIVGAAFPMLQIIEKSLKGGYLYFKRSVLFTMAAVGIFWMIQRLVTG